MGGGTAREVPAPDDRITIEVVQMWKRRMETRTVTVKFGGDIDGVSVDTFTQVVLGYARVLQSAAAETDPETKIDIKITATHPGCLEAELQAAVQQLPGILAAVSQVSDQLLPIIQSVNGYLELRRFLAKNGAPKDIATTNDGIHVVAGNNATINITQNVYKLSTSNAVDSATESMFSALESDGDIESVALKTDGADDFESPSDEFPSLKAAPQCTIGDERTEMVSQVLLSITKPILEVSDKRKWEFYWNGNKTTGYMADMGFLKKLVSHEYTFGIGDDILADLELTQHRNSMNVWENKRIRIIKVYDVIAQPRDQHLF